MKIVVIGATSGIAEHCCRLWLAEQPAELVLVARDAAKMEKIAAVTDPMAVPAQQVSGIELHPVLSRGLSGSGDTYYGFSGKYLLIGTSTGSFARMVNAQDASLNRDLDFTHALKPLPQPNIGVSFLSIPRLVELMRPLAGSNFSTDVEPLLKPFKALSVAFGVPNADGQTATLYVYVSE